MKEHQQRPHSPPLLHGRHLPRGTPPPQSGTSSGVPEGNLSERRRSLTPDQVKQPDSRNGDPVSGMKLIFLLIYFEFLEIHLKKQKHPGKEELKLKVTAEK